MSLGVTVSSNLDVFLKKVQWGGSFPIPKITSQIFWFQNGINGKRGEKNWGKLGKDWKKVGKSWKKIGEKKLGKGWEKTWKKVGKKLGKSWVKN